MEFIRVSPGNDLSVPVKVLQEAHRTVAEEFGFTKETNPTNNAFIDETTLRAQLEKGIELYQLNENDIAVGCIAIEKSKKEEDTFFIEKVSIIPKYRNQGYGIAMMDFAARTIKDRGGKRISIALIDSNIWLKKWYTNQGFTETEIKDFPRLPFRVCFMNKPV
ncbi:MAG: N-acetyltransferase [Ignavibacteriae bacterium]|nr:MAG: N-acetyltransferase [Ignavibacteriota bacterium]